MFKKSRLYLSFIYAFRGVSDALKSEPNLKIHIFLGTISVILGLLLNLSPVEWSVLVLTIFLVITLELINTVLEKIVDIASPQISEPARIAKDIAAAVVLLGAAASLIVGLFLFLPKLVYLVI